MLLLQAEQLLPDMEEMGAITEDEYMVLAHHAAAEGQDEKARKWAELASKSDDPVNKANAHFVYGAIAYMKNNLDPAHKEFEEGLRIIGQSKKLIAHEQSLKLVQAYVLWSGLEMEYGDQGYQKVEDIVKRGQAEAERIRPGVIRSSAEGILKNKLDEIERRRATKKPASMP
jgi:hypothetical protein